MYENMKCEFCGKKYGYQQKDCLSCGASVDFVPKPTLKETYHESNKNIDRKGYDINDEDNSAIFGILRAITSNINVIARRIFVFIIVIVLIIAGVKIFSILANLEKNKKSANYQRHIKSAVQFL